MKNKILLLTLLTLFLLTGMATVNAMYVPAWFNSTGDNQNLDNLIEGLEAGWNLDDSGATLVDVYSGTYNGSYVGATSGQNGIINFSFYLDGNDYLNFPQFHSTDPQNLTYSYWINYTKSGGDGIVQRLLSSQSEFDGYIAVSDDKITLITRNANTFTSNSAISQNVWTHIAYTCDAVTGNETLYINGVPDKSVINPAPINKCPVIVAGGIKFGTLYSLNRYYAGLVDEMYFWNDYLNSSEISQLYNSGQALTFGYELVPISAVLVSPSNETHTNDFLNYTVQLDCANGCSNATIYFKNLTDTIHTQLTDLGNITSIELGTQVNASAYGSDGDYVWYYTLKDGLNNEITSDELTITIDTEPPFLDWVSPSTDLFTEATTYNLNISITDPYLDAVNVTITNETGTEIYNNFSDYINTTLFNILDTIPLDLGENEVEVCARDTLAGSPKIRDLLNLYKQFPNANDETFDLELDNGVVIRRTTYIINNGGMKVSRADYDLDITDAWDSEGKHIKTDITSDKLGTHMWGIRVDFECVKGCDSMIYLDDRGKDRIIDSGRNLYFNYDDAVSEGWDVQYAQYGDKASVIISYPDLAFYNSQPIRHTIDPITGGLNSLCESYNITRQVAPIVTITLPVQDTIYSEISDLKYSYTGDCESVWYSLDNGNTNSSLGTCGVDFSGLTAFVGTNTWTVYMNNSVGSEDSDSVTFEKVNFEGEIFLQSDETGIYSLIRGVGAGFGLFLNNISIPLGYLLIVLIVVVIIGIVGYFIAQLMSKSIRFNK